MFAKRIIFTSLNDKKTMIYLISILCIIIIAPGFFSYKSSKERVYHQIEEQLQSITNLKINQLSDWYIDEFNDAAVISQNQYIIEILNKTKFSEYSEKNSIKNLLIQIKKEHNYSEVSLFSTYKEIISSSETVNNQDNEILNGLNEAERTQSTKTTNLFLSASRIDTISIAFISPVRVKNKIIAYFVFLMDANQFITPLLEAWPLINNSAETILYRKDADSILVLNELRYKKNTALNYKVSLSQSENLLVQGVLGKSGLLSGTDYRNIEVFAFASHITGTQWYISCKIDKSEALSQLTYVFYRILFICIILLSVVLGGLLIVYNRYQKNFYKELHNKDKELLSFNEKYQITLNNLGDGVITTDVNGKVQYLNKMAEILTEWNLEESNGKNLNEIYKIKNELTNDEVNDITQKILKQGIVKELANHTILISKSGKHIPVMDTGTPIYDNDGAIIGLVIIFKDETEKRQQQKYIIENERNLKNIADNITDIVFTTDLNFNVTFITPSVEKVFGFSPEAYMKLKLEERHPPESIGIIYKIYNEEYENEKNQNLDKNRTRIIELEHYKQDESKIYISMHTSFVRDDEGKPIGILGVTRDITSEKKIKTELKIERDKFAKIVDTAPGAICMFSLKADGTIYFPYCSPAIKEILGFSAEELKNNANFLKDYVPQEYIENIRTELKESAEQLSLLHSEFLYNHPSKGEIWIEIRFLPTIDENKVIVWNGFLIDITEQKRAEKEYKQLINGMNDTTFVIDFNAKFLEVNDTAVKNLGYSREELLKMGPVDIDSSLDPEIIKDLVANMKFDEKQVFETSHTTKDCRILPIEISSSPILYFGNKAILSVARDISERIKYRNELIEAKEKAEEGNRLKTAFLQNMSHEIRTPLNGILGFIRLLQEPDLSEEEKNEFIQIVNASGKRLLDTINSIIEISKIDAGQMPILISVVNIYEIMSFFFDFFELAARDKGLLFEIREMIPYEKSIIYSDKQKIDGIITNLINNAIKFTPSGSIEFGNYLDKDMLVFYVKDTGVGIPKEKVDSIFERFVQADVNITRSFEGSGLGLAIVKAYIEMLNGNIWVESVYGKGTTFYFSIPYNPVKSKTEHIEEQIVNPVSLKKYITILIAEDDDISFRFLKNILQKEGINVIRTTHGEDTIKEVMENPDINLVLMDVKMPVINGYEATRVIREFNKNIPIIAQTAYALTGDKELAIEAGCNDYITKPINSEDLFILINKYCEKK
ncbi:MAG TPA: PAS domain S-box protein [Candidatus Kapabacteria bacterium]|nr:PAS domain S-box protein [Candidatus Kapabacteria bacterium]